MFDVRSNHDVFHAPHAPLRVAANQYIPFSYSSFPTASAYAVACVRQWEMVINMRAMPSRSQASRAPPASAIVGWPSG
jgi:hypothetical protein